MINRGTAYLSNGDYDRAIHDYSEAVQLRPDVEVGFFNRGIAHAMKNEQDLAIEDYEQAIRINLRMSAL